MNYDKAVARIMYADSDPFDFPRLGMICFGLLMIDAHPILQFIYCVGAFTLLFVFAEPDRERP